MRLLSSLTNRIFLASSLLAVLAVAIAVYVVNVQVTSQAEAELRRGLVEAATLLEQYRLTLLENFIRQARLIADLPRLKAAVALDDPPTVTPIADDYRVQIDSDLFVVTNSNGHVLAGIGGAGFNDEQVSALPAIRNALEGRQSTSFWPRANEVLQVVTVPVWIGPGPEQPEILGTLSVGFELDDRMVGRMRELTDSEIVISVDGRVQATTLANIDRVLDTLLSSTGVTRVTLGDHEYVALIQPLSTGRPASTGTADATSSELTSDRSHIPTAIILRSRTERLRFLGALHTALGATAVFAVLLAVLLSYAVARTVTRPLGAITATMREMAATGDLTRKLALPEDRDWHDEDALLLATTFNSMTESIDRFQREVAQRERLSSLGRLSTVVAHEIRNPLMIIKTALRTLRRSDSDRERIRTAVADIDEEVERLNRIVNEVLDFARPIRFVYSATDVNALCADAAAATQVGTSHPGIQLSLDPAVPKIVTDPERLRLALVNVLTNARHAVLAVSREAEGHLTPTDGELADENPGDGRDANSPAPPQTAGDVPVELLTQLTKDGRVAIVVRDRGTGIGANVLSRVFDPFFTTKRTGSGLGLAIVKNIIEGLAGTIEVRSWVGVGTELTIELPVTPPHAVERRSPEPQQTTTA